MHQYTLAELKAGLERGDFSARELAEHYLARIEQLDNQLNSLITVTPAQALAQADQADVARQKGQAGLLNGLPIVHKDIFCTKGVRSSCASRMLDNFISPYDATVVEKMAQAGAVMLGKANMDEFAMGSTSESSFYGAVKNPWDTQRVAGGSSGGSAACVAARLAPAATGSDTGGSIRQPASFTSLTGLKPTYGRVSRWGMIAFASSLDQAGPIARTAEDCALLLSAMAGHDAKDSTCVKRPQDDYLGELDRSLDGLTIGVPQEFFPATLDGSIAACVETAIKQLEAMGAKVKTLSLPSLRLAIPAYYVIAPAEASSNLSRYDGVRFGYRCDQPADLQDLYFRSRTEGFGEEVKRRILIGTFALSQGYYDAYYLRAQKVRRRIRDDMVAALAEVDVLLGPTVPELPWLLGSQQDDPVQMYLADVFTIGANLAGLPAMSFPAGFVDGLPVGAQLIGPHFGEGRLLNIAHRYQQETDWHRRMPELAKGGVQ